MYKAQQQWVEGSAESQSTMTQEKKLPPTEGAGQSCMALGSSALTQESPTPSPASCSHRHSPGSACHAGLSAH